MEDFGFSTSLSNSSSLGSPIQIDVPFGTLNGMNSGNTIFYPSGSGARTTLPTTIITFSNVLAGNNDLYMTRVYTYGGSYIPTLQYSYNGGAWTTYTSNFKISSGSTLSIRVQTTNVLSAIFGGYILLADTAQRTITSVPFSGDWGGEPG